MPDEIIKLVSDVQKGSSDAFNKIYNKFCSRVYSLAYSILKDHGLAEDVLQDTFISVYRNIHTVRKMESFRSWIYSIAINHCKALLRKKDIKVLEESKEGQLYDNVEEESEDFIPDYYVEQKERRRFVIKLINSLPIDKRTTLIMFYFNNLSIKEISEVTKCNENTVKNRLFSARKQIKNALVAQMEESNEDISAMLYGVLPITQLFKDFAAENNLTGQASAELFKRVQTSVSSADNKFKNHSKAQQGTSSFTSTGAVVAGTIGIVAIITVGFLIYFSQTNKANISPINTDIQIAKSEVPPLADITAALIPANTTSVPSVEPSQILLPTPSPEPTIKPERTPSPTLKPERTPSPTLKPTLTPTITPIPSLEPTPSDTLIIVPSPTPLPSSSYYQDFSDPTTYSGWTIVAGSGIIDIINFQLNLTADDTYTIAIDTIVPDLNNGTYEGDITLSTDAGGAGFIFRYTSETSWAFIGYDSDQRWVWTNGEGSTGELTTSGPILNSGDTFHLKIQISGSHYAVWVDEIEIFNGPIPHLPTSAGKIGVGQWNNAVGCFDNLLYQESGA